MKKVVLSERSTEDLEESRTSINFGHLHAIDDQFISSRKQIITILNLIQKLNFPSESETIFAVPKPVRAISKDDFVPKELPSQDQKIIKNPEYAPTITEQIKISVYNHNNPPKIIAPKKNKRGRPEDIKDCSEIALKELMGTWEKELRKRLKRDQRSDAFFASVGRYIKKIPDLFLKYIGSKCQYKSRDIRIVLRSYLRCFLQGFLTMFPLPDSMDFLNVFLDFCILSFPDSKITKILSLLKDEGSIDEAIYKTKLTSLKIRVRASKMSYKALIDQNDCLKLICSILKNHFTLIDGDDERKIENVLEFLS